MSLTANASLLFCPSYHNTYIIHHQSIYYPPVISGRHCYDYTYFFYFTHFVMNDSLQNMSKYNLPSGNLPNKVKTSSPFRVGRLWKECVVPHDSKCSDKSIFDLSRKYLGNLLCQNIVQLSYAGIKGVVKNIVCVFSLDSWEICNWSQRCLVRHSVAYLSSFTLVICRGILRSSDII